MPVDGRLVVDLYRAALAMMRAPESSDRHVATSTAATALATIAGVGVAALRFQADHANADAISALQKIARISLGQEPA